MDHAPRVGPLQRLELRRDLAQAAGVAVRELQLERRIVVEERRREADQVHVEEEVVVDREPPGVPHRLGAAPRLHQHEVELDLDLVLVVAGAHVRQAVAEPGEVPALWT